ncbi:unnamed protein product [Strongylus vulgaris]|uniref:Uncharacterized protein n=1 Tax=Strongylus vulgaris TaxID=40348 RepID=A0A3P7JRK9_STRVU|nr:unnamed protein product [Strongylus vulgaris]
MITNLLQKIIFCATQGEQSSELSDQEIAAIKDVWARARNGDVGTKILSALIEKKPTFAMYYGFEMSLNSDEMRKSELFILQARRIQNFLDTIVASLGVSPDSTIHHMAYRIGQIHYYKGVNFGADNWLVFKKVTIEQVISLQKKPSMFSLTPTKDYNYAEVAPFLFSQKKPSTYASFQVTMESTRAAIQRGSMDTIGWNKLMAIIIREMKRGKL